ncbi:hypothetical protein LOS8367_03725 [Limimaricola soesokkakensis]|uniref:Uncharacterized protein n=1 Tax=Limimaricola soesokkakensis TaxID=1343159 RepID=A0A1X7A839_9RHOB|nr:hypothetical protein LOS8367_03725 [Limimaricola soesokkakensis]
MKLEVAPAALLPAASANTPAAIEIWPSPLGHEPLAGGCAT